MENFRRGGAKGISPYGGYIFITASAAIYIYKP
jgi:hypothetical protein